MKTTATLACSGQTSTLNDLIIQFHVLYQSPISYNNNLKLIKLISQIDQASGWEDLSLSDKASYEECRQKVLDNISELSGNHRVKVKAFQLGLIYQQDVAKSSTNVLDILEKAGLGNDKLSLSDQVISLLQAIITEIEIQEEGTINYCSTHGKFKTIIVKMKDEIIERWPDFEEAERQAMRIPLQLFKSFNQAALSIH